MPPSLNRVDVSAYGNGHGGLDVLVPVFELFHTSERPSLPTTVHDLDIF